MCFNTGQPSATSGKTMAWSFATLDRALKLIGAPLTLEILDGLGHGIPPTDAAPLDTDPAAIASAVDQLRSFGAVRGSFPGTDDGSLSLTPLGQRLLGALEKADTLDDPAVTG
jgi:hypothetical protein